MAIKQKDVMEYFTTVVDLRNALANLTEFVDSLPAPKAEDLENYLAGKSGGDCAGLTTINYAHVGSLKHIRSLIGSAIQHTDGFDS